ncbi:PTS system, fructose subfamily, IIC component [Streptomyces sp. yr375]|uniref:PTS fructose transporter subunit IIC n=1 Tax=Streptomyces sp. yr375 TaxID=1761906 RepID=UPI0008CBFB78|nr:PTS fructose transporter subunit IIC [Streptomyces sp. yr375]SEP62158.1 PTS system, fructose subfamily, IIC component [Streptomyces sp. yr375]
MPRPTAPQAPRTSRPTAPMNENAAPGEHAGIRLGRWLGGGIAYIGPIAAVGGLLLAVAYLISGWQISVTGAKMTEQSFAWTHADSWAALMLRSGVSALGFLVPAIAAYVAYGMAGRPALIPGVVGGLVAMDVESGFLGGLAAGLVAGALTVALARIRVPHALRDLFDDVAVPLVAALVVSVLMFALVREWLADLETGMNTMLTSLTGGSALVMGLVIGALVCSDLGGPISKITFGFVAGGMSVANSYNLGLVAAMVAAGMVPALGMSLATIVRRKAFRPADRQYGKVAWLLGLAGVSEGAIPFAAADPLRVLPASMAGGAVTGVLTMAFGSTQKALYGGFFAAGEISGLLLYVAAVAAGTLVTAATAIALKSLGKRPATSPANTTTRTLKAGVKPRVKARRKMSVVG